MYIIVAGGGKVGYNLARMLINAGHEALLIERDRARYRELSDMLGESVLYGDASDAGTLKEAGANRAEVIAACTGRDEDNLITCQMARHLFMVARTIARVSDPTYEDLFRSLGVDAVINSTRLIDALIEREVDSEMLVPLFSLGGGKFEIVQTDIADDSPAVGKPVRKLGLPKGSLIVSVIRGGEPIVPGSDTVLQAGDGVVALLSTGQAEALHKAFAG